MLRKEINEGISWLEEQTHRLVALLVVCLLLTPIIGHLAGTIRRAQAPQIGEASLQKALEILHRVINTVDVLIAILLAVALIYRRFLMRKDNVEWSGALNDDELQKSLKGLFDRPDADAIVPVVKYSDLDDIDELSAMNYEAFKDGRFGIDEEKLYRRNRHYLAKNPRIFLFINNPFKPNRHIGYSAMVPLTDEGLQCYLDGGLKDADIPSALVAEDQEHTAGILVFAMHLLPTYSYVKTSAARDFTRYFLACIRHHAWSLFSPSGPNGEYPPLFVQTGVNSLRRRMSKDWHFKPTQHISGDGCAILKLDHPFGSETNLSTSAKS
jgi:hypothetical protein